MATMIVFGRTADGVLSKCSSKPENRGKGNCPHSAHFELPSDKADQILQKDAERQLQRKHQQFAVLQKRAEKKTRKEARKIAEMEKFKKFNNPETIAKINNLTEQYSSENFEYINTFINNLKEMIPNDSKSENPEKTVEKLLMDDSFSTKKIKEKFGDNYSLSDISELLVRIPSSMTKKSKSKNGNNSSSRILLIGIENDMDREKYIKSVIYFGGKCCYCGVMLKTEDGENYRKATGEHLTPLSPENKDSVRSFTRFGNMALCCDICNHSRGNQDLEPWIFKTSRIKKNQKINTIAKIRAFRKFAGYKEFNKTFSQEIDKSIDYLYQESEEIRLKKHRSDVSEDKLHSYFREILNNEVQRLRDFPNKYDS